MDGWMDVCVCVRVASKPGERGGMQRNLGVCVDTGKPLMHVTPVLHSVYGYLDQMVFALLN